MWTPDEVDDLDRPNVVAYGEPVGLTADCNADYQVRGAPSIPDERKSNAGIGRTAILVALHTLRWRGATQTGGGSQP